MPEHGIQTIISKRLLSSVKKRYQANSRSASDNLLPLLPEPYGIYWRILHKCTFPCSWCHRWRVTSVSTLSRSDYFQYVRIGEDHFYLIHSRPSGLMNNFPPSLWTQTENALSMIRYDRPIYKCAYGATQCPLLRSWVATERRECPFCQKGLMPRKTLYMSSIW